jgi:hypothetical protein
MTLKLSRPSFGKIILYFVLFLVTVMVLINAFLFINGKRILEGKLSQAIERKVELKKVWFRLPFTLFIEGVKIDGVAPAQIVFVELGFSNIFKSEFVIKHFILSKAVVSLVKNEQGKIELKGLGSAESKEVVKIQAEPPVQTESKTAPRKSRRIIFKDIQIVGSRFEFVDQMPASDKENGFIHRVEITDLNIKLSGFVLPLQSQSVDFSAGGLLSLPDTSFNQKPIKTKGWANIVKKDMNAELWISEMDKDNSLYARMISENNNMDVNGTIKMSNFLKNFAKPGEKNESIDQVVFGALSSMGVSVGLDFSFQTQMDHVSLTNVSFKGNVVTKPVSTEKKEETAK